MAEKPWERMEGEGSKAFEAFRVYRDMGAERSLRAVGERLGKSKAIIERWSSSNQWVERVRAYDNDLERAAHLEAVKGVREMQRRHLGMAAQLQHKGMLALQSLDPNSMNAKVLIKYITDGAKLEREARNAIVGDCEKINRDGMAKRNEGQLSVSELPGGGAIDMSSLSDEELVDLERLLEKLHPKRND